MLICHKGHLVFIKFLDDAEVVVGLYYTIGSSYTQKHMILGDRRDVVCIAAFIPYLVHNLEVLRIKYHVSGMLVAIKQLEFFALW